MTTAYTQAHDVTAPVSRTASLVQNIRPIRHIVDDDQYLGRFLFVFLAHLDDGRLICDDLTQSAHVHVVEIQLLAGRHLIKVLAKFLVAVVHQDGGTEDKDSIPHALVHPQNQRKPRLALA
jgi:hypothetical protein